LLREPSLLDGTYSSLQLSRIMLLSQPSEGRSCLQLTEWLLLLGAAAWQDLQVAERAAGYSQGRWQNMSLL
jgi:hypothetical protein